MQKILLIFTIEKDFSFLREFIDFKEEAGFMCICHTVSGNLKQRQITIQESINDFYNQLKDTFFVLLLGDSTILPVPTADYKSIYWFNSDTFYSINYKELESTFIFKCAIGRFPVNTVDLLKSMSLRYVHNKSKVPTSFSFIVGEKSLVEKCEEILLPDGKCDNKVYSNKMSSGDFNNYMVSLACNYSDYVCYMGHGDTGFWTVINKESELNTAELYFFDNKTLPLHIASYACLTNSYIGEMAKKYFVDRDILSFWGASGVVYCDIVNAILPIYWELYKKRNSDYIGILYYESLIETFKCKDLKKQPEILGNICCFHLLGDPSVVI